MTTHTTPELTTTETPAKTDIRIVVLQRGWNVIGTYSQVGDEVTITRASVIRRWGTTQGLGQLINGPTPSTRLDPCGTVRAHRLAVVLTINVDTNPWAAYLK